MVSALMKPRDVYKRQADGTGLSLNPKAPHAPKAALAIELWAEKRAQLENGKIDADEYET